MIEIGQTYGHEIKQWIHQCIDGFVNVLYIATEKWVLQISMPAPLRGVPHDKDVSIHFLHRSDGRHALPLGTVWVLPLNSIWALSLVPVCASLGPGVGPPLWALPSGPSHTTSFLRKVPSANSCVIGSIVMIVWEEVWDAEVHRIRSPTKTNKWKERICIIGLSIHPQKRRVREAWKEEWKVWVAVVLIMFTNEKGACSRYGEEEWRVCSWLFRSWKKATATDENKRTHEKPKCSLFASMFTGNTASAAAIKRTQIKHFILCFVCLCPSFFLLFTVAAMSS